MDERDRLKNFSSKGKLDQYIAQGQGMEELKKDEKAIFLGEFRERVIKALTIPQLHEEGTYKEVEEAIKDPRASKLVINRKADLKKSAEYIRLAKENNIRFTTVESTNIKNTLGLIVAADYAVDIENIYVENRKDKLLAMGLSENVIDNPGMKLCSKCFEQLKEKAPEEVKNYKTLTFADRILGTKCEGC